MTKEDQKQILIIDDTETDIDLLVEMLVKDYRIQVAMSGKRGIRLAQAELPNLILLDIMMPTMDGYQVCKALKQNKKTKHIPIIFITVLNEEQNETEGLSLGAVDYITKPFSPDIVRARIKNHLELQDQKEILIENLRLKELFDDMLRHDLKNPLSAIISIPELLEKQLSLTPKHSTMLKMIREAGVSILKMINSSLDMTRMERGLYIYQPIQLDVIKLLHRILSELCGLVASKELIIEFYKNNKAIDVDTDFLMMTEELLCYSMLSNLLRNAIEASPVRETIRIDLSRSKEKIEIRITNKGEVAPSIRKCFFDKYVTYGKSGGTGLGTYSARLMCEAMQGKIGFDSNSTIGTSVFVRFLVPYSSKTIKKNKKL